MATSMPEALLLSAYEKAACDYQRSLPLEHYMESTSQSTQRKITLESLDLVAAQRADFQVFSELLVQYPLKGGRIGQVVPDNMVVIWPEPIEAEGSYNLPLQPTGPYWTLEYVSKTNRRKDYQDNMRKYEKELKVPYYLMFSPEAQEMTLFHRGKSKYRSVKPNAHGRCAIEDLELEMALLDGWVRYWFRGKLLPLPADLLHELEETRQRLEQATQRADRLEHRAGQAEHRAGQAEYRVSQVEQQIEEERRARLAAEEELAQLRAQMQSSRRDNPS